MPSYVYDNALIYNVHYNAVINNVYDNALIYVTFQGRRRLQTRGRTGHSWTPAAASRRTSRCSCSVETALESS